MISDSMHLQKFLLSLYRCCRCCCCYYLLCESGCRVRLLETCHEIKAFGYSSSENEDAALSGNLS